MGNQAQQLRELAHRRYQDARRPGGPTTQNAARVIVITSGKGGVGKTNVTVNLALALARQQKRTILFDADLGMANVDVLMGISPRHTLAEVIRGKRTLEDILLPYQEYLSVIPGGAGLQELADLSQVQIETFLAKLRTLEQSADFILVDTGAGISRNVMNFVLAASEVLLVTTPEPTSITDAYGMIKTIDQQNPLAQVNLLVNMVESEQEARLVAQKLIMIVNRFLDIEVKYLSYMEWDPNVGRSVLQQQPFYLAYPYGPATRRINLLANSFVAPQEGQGPPASAASFFHRLVRLFR